MLRMVTCLTLVLIALSMVHCGSSGSGSVLDTSFGSGGKVTLDFGSSNDEARGVAVQSDGKIVAAGVTNASSSTDDFGVARFSDSGAIDSSFGGKGRISIDFGSSTDAGNAVALMGDGRIVIGGTSGNTFAVARVGTDGTLDGSFGSSGKSLVAIGTLTDDCKAIALQSDGKVVLAGSSKSGSQLNFTVARLTAAGALDSTFHANGKFVIPFGSSDSVANSVMIDTEGKIVAAGYAKLGTKNGFAIVRMNTDGSFDSNFSGGGKVNFAVGSNTDDAAYGIAQDSQQHLVAAGTAVSTTGTAIAVARLSLLGVLDDTFNSIGRFTTNFDSVDNSNARGLVTTSASGIVTAGTAGNATDDFGISRITFNGAIDNSLSGTGKLTTDFNGGADQALAITRVNDSRIIVAGKAYNGSNFDFALTKYKQ